MDATISNGGDRVPGWFSGSMDCALAMGKGSGSEYRGKKTASFGA